MIESWANRLDYKTKREHFSVGNNMIEGVTTITKDGEIISFPKNDILIVQSFLRIPENENITSIRDIKNRIRYLGRTKYIIQPSNAKTLGDIKQVVFIQRFRVYKDMIASENRFHDAVQEIASATNFVSALLIDNSPKADIEKPELFDSPEFA